MGKIRAHPVYDTNRETGEENGHVIAHVHPASDDAVKTVLSAPQKGYDGRSNWVWIRFPNGDLCLAVYPQGDTYCAVEYDAQYPHPGVKPLEKID